MSLVAEVKSGDRGGRAQSAQLLSLGAQKKSGGGGVDESTVLTF